MNKELVELLNSNKKTKEFYSLHKKRLIGFARKNSIDYDVFDEIYQDSFVTLITEIKKGNKIESLKDYLFKIVSNRIAAYFTQQRRFIDMDEGQLLLQPNTEYRHEKDRALEIAYHRVITMDDPCKSVLSMYLWGNKSMEEIASEMGYTSVQSAKNRKSKCYNTLVEDIRKQLEEEGLL